MSTQNTAVEPLISTETAELIRKSLQAGHSLSEILDALSMGPEAEQVQAKAVVPVTLSEAAIKAAKQLPDVFGSVNPSTVRKLTDPEKAKLVAEREVLTLLEKEVKNRRTGENGIGQIGHNHLDKITEAQCEADGTPLPAVDARGHYLNKIADAVDNTGQSLVREVRTSKPAISNEMLHQAYQAGDISHAEWLRVTATPETPRVFDEIKAREAVKKDPALLAKLAAYATTPAKVTSAFTIKPTK